MNYLLAIDQGTTNSRAIIFNDVGEMLSQHSIALNQHFPQDGWVEQDPQEMFNNTISCCRAVLKNVNCSAQSIAAIGISNQRETTILWDKSSGQPIYPAIVWQDRRTKDLCKKISESKLGPALWQKTGLLLDPYFSATKIMWILDHVPNARDKALRGEVLFGTVDTFLLWKLTNGKSHATDATNASRTLLFNIRTQAWDEDILQALNIPSQILPQVLDNTAHFGDMDPRILGAKIPITGIAGDQQAATVGQACFHRGMVKATFGTGCFMVLNTGQEIIASKNKLLSTIAYRINNQVTYALEGSIFSAGVIVKWLRDTLKLIQNAADTETLANRVKDTNGVYLVPAFTGLGAPYWDPRARGALLGLTRNTEVAHIARAALESVAYQSKDLLDAMLNDSQSSLESLRVDGGMVVNNWLLQFVSNILDIEVQRPICVETSALGAAYLAGLYVGIFKSLSEIEKTWHMDARFTPHMEKQQRDRLYGGWQEAIKRILS